MQGYAKNSTQYRVRPLFCVGEIQLGKKISYTQLHWDYINFNMIILTIYIAILCFTLFHTLMFRCSFMLIEWVNILDIVLILTI